jgi:hypothetical protein
VPEKEGVRCTAGHDSSIKWAVVLNVLCKKKLLYCGSLPILAHVESCEGETCPPPPRALIPLQPGHYRFSLLAAFKWDGPGWCTSRGFTCSLIRDPQLWDSVLYFSSNNTVSWNILQMVYPRSIDWYYLLGWLTTLRNKSFNLH